MHVHCYIVQTWGQWLVVRNVVLLALDPGPPAVCATREPGPRLTDLNERALGHWQLDIRPEDMGHGAWYMACQHTYNINKYVPRFFEIEWGHTTLD